MPNLLIGLSFGVLVGLFLSRFVIPYLDILFEVFTAKKSEIITEYNLNIQSMSCEIMRQYPELSNDSNTDTGQINMIGFQYSGENEEYYEEDDIKLKNNNLKFKNKRSI